MCLISFEHIFIFLYMLDLSFKIILDKLTDILHLCKDSVLEIQVNGSIILKIILSI